MIFSRVPGADGSSNVLFRNHRVGVVSDNYFQRGLLLEWFRRM